MLKSLLTSVVKLDTYVVSLGHAVLCEDVRAAADSAWCIEEAASVCGSYEGKEREAERCLFCFDVCDDLSSERLLNL